MIFNRGDKTERRFCPPEAARNRNHPSSQAQRPPTPAAHRPGALFPKPPPQPDPHCSNLTNPQQKTGVHMGIGHQQGGSRSQVSSRAPKTSRSTARSMADGARAWGRENWPGTPRLKGTVLLAMRSSWPAPSKARSTAKKVILTGTAPRMTGDVLHQDIKIESGAYVQRQPEAGDRQIRRQAGPSKPVTNTSSAQRFIRQRLAR